MKKPFLKNPRTINRNLVDDNLLNACVTGDAVRINKALDDGGSLTARGEDGKTPLMLAATVLSARGIRIILSRPSGESTINAQDDAVEGIGGGYTALMHAIETEDGDNARRIHCVMALLAAGADTTIRNNLGETAMDMAHALGDDVSMRAIEHHCQEKAKQSQLIDATEDMESCSLSL